MPLRLFRPTDLQQLIHFVFDSLLTGGAVNCSCVLFLLAEIRGNNLERHQVQPTAKIGFHGLAKLDDRLRTNSSPDCQ